MEYNAGKRIYKDIRTFQITTQQIEQSIISNDYINRENEAIMYLELKSDKDCELTFDYQNDNDKRYPKFIKANNCYVFENLNPILDVKFKGEINTNILIGFCV